VHCGEPGEPGVPEPGNEKARKGAKAEEGVEDMDLGAPKRSRPALMLTGDGMPGFPTAWPGVSRDGSLFMLYLWQIMLNYVSCRTGAKNSSFSD
jgi:hypothetical protein